MGNGDGELGNGEWLGNKRTGMRQKSATQFAGVARFLRLGGSEGMVDRGDGVGSVVVMVDVREGVVWMIDAGYSKEIGI